MVNLGTDDPIILLPGDEIVTTCEFSTAKLDHSVVQGEATSDEMCSGVLTYYPKSNVTNEFCFSGGPGISYCDPASWSRFQCADPYAFLSPSSVNVSSLYQGLVSNCRPFGPCLQECVQYITQQARVDGCLRGEIYKYIQENILSFHEEGRNMMALMASCQTEVYLAMAAITPTVEERGLALHISAGALLVVLVPALVLLF
ncbi:uncharacterized protein LOC131938460 [Physella acuta]|uniref:uncharacterized protein LOC131938460 n=1 Tax=Physella acuta TaxID=109671 RepID=UPI0027DAB772|nr:uncharacterized protein LOC131938460 [Physella acuta]